MKVVIDEKIPYIKGVIELLADEVIYLPGSKISSEDVKDADALFVRTRTQCNENLLKNSSVKFIATATIGYDHIDTEYCRKNGIYWTNAPGCNSSSVAQYIRSCLLLLKKEKGMDLSGICLGIVGVGNVGSQVYKLAESMGIKVLLNDPPRKDKGDNLPFTDLQTIARECNIITFHTPLIKEGIYRTFYLADKEFMESLKKQPILINTSRGEVIETAALLQALEDNKIKEAIIDVWENEPDISLSLLEKAYLSTPHIAGYSADGKANATRMSLEAFCRFFDLNASFNITPPAPIHPTLQVENEEDAYLLMYDPTQDSNALKKSPAKFEELRNNYPLRREKEGYEIILQKEPSNLIKGAVH